MPYGDHFDILFSSFLCVVLVKDYLMQSYQALKIFRCSLITLAESVKVGSPQKVAQSGKQIFYDVFLTVDYIDLVL